MLETGRYGARRWPRYTPTSATPMSCSGKSARWLRLFPVTPSCCRRVAVGSPWRTGKPVSGLKLNSMIGRLSPALLKPCSLVSPCSHPRPDQPAALVGAVEEDRHRFLIQPYRAGSRMDRKRGHCTNSGNRCLLPRWNGQFHHA